MILDNSIVEQVIGLVDGAEHKRGVLISVCFDYGARHFARQLDRAASVAGNIAHAERAQPDLWHKLAESIGVQPGCMMPGTGDRSAPSWCAPAVITKWLGRADTWVTARIFAHLQVDASRSAAQILDAALTMS